MSRRTALVALLTASLAVAASGCDSHPTTSVVFDNAYAARVPPLVVYRARWEATSFADAVAPGTSAGAQETVPTSGSLAYVVLAPGWDGVSPPASLVVLESRTAYGVHLNDALRISISDATFAGNCAAGSSLSQAEADFITRRIFPSEFAGLKYDAATCVATVDASAQ